MFSLLYPTMISIDAVELMSVTLILVVFYAFLLSKNYMTLYYFKLVICACFIPL